MRIIILVALFMPYGYLAAETINCNFDRFHQVNHEVPEMTGYALIDQSLEIVAGKTSDNTLKLDGKKRDTNSTSWVLLEREGWETHSTTYAGDFGELLTIEHELGQNSRSLNGWYKASLISSKVITTYTSLGRCLIK